MKPKIVEAYACGRCHSLHPFNEHGKAFAEACCLCVTCNKNPSSYTGRGTECTECHGARCLKSAKESFAQAKATLDGINEEMTRRVVRKGG